MKRQRPLHPFVTCASAPEALSFTCWLAARGIAHHAHLSEQPYPRVEFILLRPQAQTTANEYYRRYLYEKALARAMEER